MKTKHLYLLMGLIAVMIGGGVWLVNNSRTYYQPSDNEKSLYLQAISFLQNKHETRCENKQFRWYFCYYDTSNAMREKSLSLFKELVKRYPNSYFYPHYYEVMTLLNQMVEEDKTCKWPIRPNARGSNSNLPYFDPKTLSIDERIAYDIYHLRNAEIERMDPPFANYRFTIRIPWGSYPDLAGYWEAKDLIRLLDKKSVSTLLNLIEDRRPIIAIDIDSDKIPDRIYRYQDVALEIIEYLFIFDNHEILTDSRLYWEKYKWRDPQPRFFAKRKFPLEINKSEYFSEYLYPPLRFVAGRELPFVETNKEEYFSEYLDRQPKETQQKIINEIKRWIEESINNPFDPPQQPPESPK